MLDHTLLLAAGGSTILLGGGLLWAVHADRRKGRRERRLKALVRVGPSPERPVMALRRPSPQQKALPAAIATRLDLALAATGNRIGPLHLAVISAIGAAAVALASVASQLPSALAVALGGAAAIAPPALLVRLLQSRYQRRFVDVFPDALDLIVRAVRAGLPAPEAIELATREIGPPVGAEFQRMLDELRIGADMEECLLRAAERIRVPDFRFFVVSLMLQRQTGGGIAEILANLSTIIRQRKALRLKARALSAEAQASAAIVGTTPFVAGVGLFLINRELMSVLLVDPRGRFMLALAVIGLLSGIAVMKALISTNLR